ncbi:MAG: FAD-dependent oxidoreductase [Candidatus Paceibacterota bacterium]|jgi:NAD(P)H-nitrite reductase large subunit
MNQYKYLIIGGGAAGISAAETIRQTDKEGSMAIISDEPHPLYSRVMLSKPNFFLGQIPFEQIYLKSKDWYSTNKIDFLGGKKAVGLNTSENQLTLSDGSSVYYEKLLIATGVDARPWTVKGSDKKGIHYLRNLEDGIGIMEAIKNLEARPRGLASRAITIGGGFISFEMADLLKMAGLETTMILRESYFWEPILDEASGLMLENAMIKAGVKIIKNYEVTEVLGREKVEGVRGEASRPDLEASPRELSCDMIICGIGVVNPIEWLLKNGIATNKGVLTNEFMETNVPNIWSAGDIAEYRDILLEENVQMGNWVSAREQGRIAGLNMVRDSIASSENSVEASNKQAFKFVSFYTTQGFGTSIAFIGDVTPKPDRTIIKRGSPEINSYARFIIAHDEIEGATLINRNLEMTTISKLIESNMKVSEHVKEIEDVNFDLKRLV